MPRSHRDRNARAAIPSLLVDHARHRAAGSLASEPKVRTNPTRAVNVISTRLRGIWRDCPSTRFELMAGTACRSRSRSETGTRSTRIGPIEKAVATVASR